MRLEEQVCIERERHSSWGKLGLKWLAEGFGKVEPFSQYRRFSQ